MIKYFSIIVIALCSIYSFAQEYPQPIGYVNDFASILNTEQKNQLETQLSEFENKTTYELTVVTIPSLNNKTVETYTQELAKEWGVGKQSLNNGIVFLIAPNDRKMRIETASSSRTVLTDRKADSIRDNNILPMFKQGRLDLGIINGVQGIINALDTPIIESVSTPVMTYNKTNDDIVSIQNTKSYFKYGIIASIFGLFMLFLSVYYFREIKPKNTNIYSYLYDDGKKETVRIEYKKLKKKMDKLEINPGQKNYKKQKYQTFIKEYNNMNELYHSINPNWLLLSSMILELDQMIYPLSNQDKVSDNSNDTIDYGTYTYKSSSKHQDNNNNHSSNRRSSYRDDHSSSSSFGGFGGGNGWGDSSGGGGSSGSW